MRFFLSFLLFILSFIVLSCGSTISKRLGQDGVKWGVTSWTCGAASLSGIWPSGSTVMIDFTSSSNKMGINATLASCGEVVNYDAAFDDEASTVKVTKTGSTCTSDCRSPLSLTCSPSTISNAESITYTITLDKADETVVTFTGSSKCDGSGSAKDEIIVFKKQ